MDEVTFTFTVDEANIVLTALGDQPYARVAPLIVKMEQQARAQFPQPDPVAE